MNAAPFFELANEERMKKSILFLILLVFSCIAVVLNLTRPSDPAPGLMYMSLTNEQDGDTYRVDKTQSTLRWTGRKLTGNHTGTIDIKSGSLTMKEGVPAEGSFVIDMTSMQNEDIENAESKAKLMGHLQSDDFFGTVTYPEAKLVITDVKPGEGENMYDITADLTIKDKTNSITFPATVIEKDGTVVATADITFDRTKYNVRYGSGTIFSSLGDKAIYDDVDMRVELVARK
jgi:polyisoprenoid-binding protein YceI